MLNDQLPWVIAGVVVLALALLGVWLARRPDSMASLRRGRGPRTRGTSRAGRGLPHAGVVINPTKFADLGVVRERVTRVCHAVGWSDPVFYETTSDDPGAGQARQALDEGADLVCSLGGDGTVRAVATALIGTDTPLGILPAGTGNLLARNLDLPVDAFDEAVRVALTGRDRRIDVGMLVVDGEDEGQPFLVMGGMGFDAAIMAGTSETLKKRVGWPAYLVSGAKSLVSPEFRVQLAIDGAPQFRRRARAIIIGNCGKLLGGLVLMPDARVDDAQLDAVIMAPRGIAGWVPVAVRVLTRRRRGHATLDHVVCQEIRVHTDRPQPVQIDGDVIGEATEVVASVRPAALTVRVSQAATG